MKQRSILAVCLVSAGLPLSAVATPSETSQGGPLKFDFYVSDETGSTWGDSSGTWLVDTSQPYEALIINFDQAKAISFDIGLDQNDWTQDDEMFWRPNNDAEYLGPLDLTDPAKGFAETEGLGLFATNGDIAHNGLYSWYFSDNTDNNEATEFVKLVNADGVELTFSKQKPGTEGADGTAAYQIYSEKPIEGADSGIYVLTIEGFGPKEQIAKLTAGDPNTSETGSLIANSCINKTGTKAFQEACTSIAQGAVLDPGGTIQALDSVTAKQATAPLSTSRASMGSQRQNVASRLVALRGGVSGISFRGLTLHERNPGLNQGVAVDGSNILTGGAASADGTILQNERFGIFVNGNFSKGDRDQTVNEPGYKFDSYSVTGGLDYRFTDSFVAGIGLGLDGSTTNIDNRGGKLSADGYTLNFFASFFPGNSFYLDGILTFGRNDYDQKRNINYIIDDTNGTVNQTASADYKGHYWSGSIGTGYNFAMGSATLTPTARLDYTSASVDGYTETMSDPDGPGAAWATKMDNFDQDAMNSYLGVSLANAFSTKQGVLVPKLELGWVHEFKDDAAVVNGTYVQDTSGGVFLIAGDKRDPDYYIGTAGITAQFSGGVAGYIQYSKVFGYRDLTVDNVGAGVRVSF